MKHLADWMLLFIREMGDPIYRESKVFKQIKKGSALDCMLEND